MNKKIPLGAAISLMLVVAAVAVSITMAVSWKTFNQTMSDVAERQVMYSKLHEVDQLVRQNYIGDIDEQKLNDGIAQGYITGTGDPYADYMTAQENEERNSTIEGNAYGVGITCTPHPKTGNIYITLVHADSPADKAGLKQGDSIVAVDGKTIEQNGYNHVFELLQGKEGSKCSIEVLRGQQTISFEVTRKEYELTTVTSHMVDSIGVIRIHSFAATTDKQFFAALDALQKQQIKGLVIDLRDNLGGTISSAEKILDVLLPSGNLYTTVYKNGDTETHESDAACVDLPMAVVVNSNTASAAELFAAAIQDFGAGKLVGTTTYGKGVMQRTYTLEDKSSVLLTFASFTTPKGTNFNGVGLTPEIPMELSEDQKKNFVLLSESDDPQLQAAFNELQSYGQ